MYFFYFLAINALEQNKMASSYLYVTKVELFFNKRSRRAIHYQKETKFGNKVFEDMYFLYFLAINALRISSKCFCLRLISGRRQAD